jgi:KaiC/GvpD/RAD55 family RecA-like ATPase
MKKFKTGILPLDTQLTGGIPGGSVVLILEDPGAGGDVFTFHFAIEGAVNDEKVFYLSTDDTEEEIKEYIQVYFNVGEEIWEHVVIVSLSSFRQGIRKDVKDYLRRTMYDPMSGLKTILSNEDFERVIINNLTYFVTNYELEGVIAFIEDLSTIAKQNESVVLLTMTRGMFDPRVETTMKHYADGVFELTLREVENEVQRRLKIIKFKRILVPKAILRYDLTEKGVRMESVMRVL